MLRPKVFARRPRWFSESSGPSGPRSRPLGRPSVPSNQRRLSRRCFPPSPLGRRSRPLRTFDPPSQPRRFSGPPRRSAQQSRSPPPPLWPWTSRFSGRSNRTDRQSRPARPFNRRASRQPPPSTKSCRRTGRSSRYSGPPGRCPSPSNGQPTPPPPLRYQPDRQARPRDNPPGRPPQCHRPPQRLRPHNSPPNPSGLRSVSPKPASPGSDPSDPPSRRASSPGHPPNPSQLRSPRPRRPSSGYAGRVSSTLSRQLSLCPSRHRPPNHQCDPCSGEASGHR